MKTDSNVAEFKQCVEKDWTVDETAAAWQKHYPQMKKQLTEVTKALVDAAPQPGVFILDLASGTGEPSLESCAPRGATGQEIRRVLRRDCVCRLPSPGSYFGPLPAVHPAPAGQATS